MHVREGREAVGKLGFTTPQARGNPHAHEFKCHTHLSQVSYPQSTEVKRLDKVSVACFEIALSWSRRFFLALKLHDAFSFGLDKCI